MSLSLSRLVPGEYDYWYYHEESGLLLNNNSEYGWVAVQSLDPAEKEIEELSEAVNAAIDAGGTIDPTGVLPLPDDYEP